VYIQRYRNETSEILCFFPISAAATEQTRVQGGEYIPQSKVTVFHLRFNTGFLSAAPRRSNPPGTRHPELRGHAVPLGASGQCEGLQRVSAATVRASRAVPAEPRPNLTKGGWIFFGLTAVHASTCISSEVLKFGETSKTGMLQGFPLRI